MRLALLLILFASLPAAACTSTDYLQMKDRAANPEGRRNIVLMYCMHKMQWDNHRKVGSLTPREATQCATEMTKAKDALTAVGATDALAQTNDCERVLPKPKG